MEELKNTRMGYVEPLYIADSAFENQRLTFTSYGYAVDPSKQFNTISADSFVGDKEKAIKHGGVTVKDRTSIKPKRKRYSTAILISGMLLEMLQKLMGFWDLGLVMKERL
jgi:hypothetical protein